jgi:formylmethanofuran dehydrogenase subunit B
MRKPVLLLSMIILVNVINAQHITSKKEIVPNDDSTTSHPTSLPGFNSQQDAQEIISAVMDVIGLHPNFKVKSGHVPNVEADIRHRQRYIIYNPKFVSQVNKVANNKWASIFIIAHEIGHHLNGHTLHGMKTQPLLELEADEFAGFVLCKMGATLQDAQLVMHYIAGMNASKSHPGRIDRLDSIARGWRKAASGNKDITHN